MLTAVLVWRKIRGAIILSVLAITALGFLVPAADSKGTLTTLPSKLIDSPASLAPTFLALDLGFVLDSRPLASIRGFNCIDMAQIYCPC